MSRNLIFVAAAADPAAKDPVGGMDGFQASPQKYAPKKSGGPSQSSALTRGRTAA